MLNLEKCWKKKLGKKVYCENDANVAAYGEYLVDDENEGDTLVAIYERKEQKGFCKDGRAK